MAGFKSGFIIGAIVVAAPAAWIVYELNDRPLRFAPAIITNTPNYVNVEGSVVGDEKDKKDRPINGGVRLTCFRSNNSCRYSSVDEIGPQQIGSIEQDDIAINSWTDDELVASSKELSEASGGCVYYEIRVLLKRQQAIYTRLPNPSADRDHCKKLFLNYATPRQWRIADGVGWTGG